MGPSTILEFITRKALDINPAEHSAGNRPEDTGKWARDAAAAGVGGPFYEKEPTVLEWLLQLVPTRNGAAKYLHSLFPSALWVRRYNARWLLGDMIAGECWQRTDRSQPC